MAADDTSAGKKSGSGRKLMTSKKNAAASPVAAAASNPSTVVDPRIRCFAGDATAAEAAARVFETASARLGVNTTRLFAGMVDLVALEIFAPPMQEQRSAVAAAYCVVVQAQ